MASFPWDIIVDILCRLPVKDLLRYRSLSKWWRSIIDGRDFINMHLNNSIETSSNLCVIISNFNLYRVDLDALDWAVKLHHPPFRGHSVESEIVGFYRGLLALWGSDYDVAIRNPSTRSDDYKLVRIVLFFRDEGEDSFESEVKIYSAKSNTWKRISDFPYDLRYSCVSGAHTNYALHWVVSRKPISDLSNFVIALDLVTEEYRKVPLPDCMGAVDFMDVEVLGGSLFLLCNYVVNHPELDLQAATDHFDMLVMKEYGVKESWTEIGTVVSSDVIGSFTYMFPIAYLKSGSQVLMNKNSKRFILCNLEIGKAKNVKISRAPKHMSTKLCVESLVGLDDGDEPFGWKWRDEEKNKNRRQRDDFLSQRFKLVLLAS